ncbi:MAG: fused MFS/spermidine synthase [Pseudomonadota bacterium]
MDSTLSLVRREAALKLLVPLFFLSGATSLVYETLWGRALHLVFGTSQVAIATVLAAFMGGLSVGGLLGARYADRIKRPLLVYGVLEGIIGAYALLFPVLVQLITPVYLGFWRAAEPSPLAFSAFQAALLGLVLLVPTTCMGATLPLLARFVTTRLDLAGSRIGLLYGVNTAGAVLGTFLAGFVLLPAPGLAATTHLAAAANGLLLAAALLLSRWGDGTEPPLVEAAAAEPPPAPGRALLLVAGLAGCASLVYELAWFRVMALTLGASTYAFSIMLLAFLTGIALGGWGGGGLADRLLARRGRVGVLLGLVAVEVGVAVATWAMMHGFEQLPFVYVRLFDLIEGKQGWFWPTWLGLSMAVMTPPAVLMGAAFTLTVRSLVADPGQLAGPVGKVYGANTVGAIIGSLGGAFVLLPKLHVVGAITTANGINLLAALVALGVAWTLAGRPRTVRWALPVGGTALLALVGLRCPPPWDPLLMTAGMFKYVTELAERTPEHVLRYAVEPYELLYYEEGLSSVVTVATNRKTGNIWLANNGKVDASSTTDMPTQVMVAHLPFFFGRDAKRACVIGLASGITAGAVTEHDELESIDLVELEPAVFEASHFFDEINHRPLEDPRVRPVVNDARNHMLLAAPGSYDVVVSEPSNPWLTGVSNLFTREFFELGKSRLGPGGVWSQWVQMYGMGTEELRALLKTFGEVFPHVALFATIEDADLVILGSDQPLLLDLPGLQRVIAANPEVAQDLDTIEVHNAYDLLTFFQMERGTLDEFTLGARENTDDNMLIEFAAPRRLYDDTSSINYRILLNEARPALSALSTLEDFKSFARAYVRREEYVRALIVLKEAEARFPGDPEVLQLYNDWQQTFKREQAEAEERARQDEAERLERRRNREGAPLAP